MNTNTSIHPIIGVIILVICMFWMTGLIFFKTQEVVEEMKTPWGVSQNKSGQEGLEDLYETNNEDF